MGGGLHETLYRHTPSGLGYAEASSHGGGTTTTLRRADPLGRLWEQRTLDDAAPTPGEIAGFVYLLDKTGQRRSVTETIGGFSKTATYVYDALDRLTGETTTETLPSAFADEAAFIGSGRLRRVARTCPSLPPKTRSARERTEQLVQRGSRTPCAAATALRSGRVLAS